ncbi:uncharacterized protein BDZ99DRAFT_184410 [Mytilinidion resinicola]|uniref:Uncharacterized protein n=1 Tax=Mytilinidion resinicola TaxID=574789 RepID=A0A6A6Z166_9PEZI|nr:uncharacterized protein BDZ99DRAFT_184410 [Mytilinidion resinicola]KAF2814770.1 hypothetical protein BDZ99DRAFT_184410 [Mytilinidion resinicola]
MTQTVTAHEQSREARKSLAQSKHSKCRNKRPQIIRNAQPRLSDWWNLPQPPSPFPAIFWQAGCRSHARRSRANRTPLHLIVYPITTTFTLPPGWYSFTSARIKLNDEE